MHTVFHQGALGVQPGGAPNPPALSGPATRPILRMPGQCKPPGFPLGCCWIGGKGLGNTLGGGHWGMGVVVAVLQVGPPRPRVGA